MIKYIKSDFSNTTELKKLWLECFDDTAEAVNLFFERLYNEMSVYCAFDDESIVSAVYLIKGRLNGFKAHYLCGASTKSEYRSRGIMSGLIEYVLAYEEKNGCVYSILMPADDKLYDFYSRLGYVPQCCVKRQSYRRQELTGFADVRSKNAETNYEQLQRSCLKSNYFEWSDICIEFAKDYYKLYGVKIIDENACFAMLEEKNNSSAVFYAVYDDLSQLAELLLKYSASERFEIISRAEDGFNNEKYGMIKSLDNTEIPENVYIGITLS